MRNVGGWHEGEGRVLHSWEKLKLGANATNKVQQTVQKEQSVLADGDEPYWR